MIDIAGSDQMAWCVDAGAIDAHVTGASECRCSAARSYQPGMPQPAVDALALRLCNHLNDGLWPRLRVALLRRRAWRTANWDPRPSHAARAVQIAPADPPTSPGHAAADRIADRRRLAGAVGAVSGGRVCEFRLPPARVAESAQERTRPVRKRRLSRPLRARHCLQQCLASARPLRAAYACAARADETADVRGAAQGGQVATLRSTRARP